MGYLAALDTEITPEIRDEGLAREFVHRVQTMRKNAGFDIADYITTTYTAGGRLAAALERHAAYVAAETLSRELCAVSTPQDVAGYTETFKVDGEETTVGVERVAR
jgi:isoleucyl-tRNA synthetase